jgi:hypothetical protein
MSQEPLNLIGLLLRRPDLTLGQFSQHWRTRHRDLSLLLIAPGIMHGYIQNHLRSDSDPIPGLPLAREIVIDGGPGRVAASSSAKSRRCFPFIRRNSQTVNRIGSLQ